MFHRPVHLRQARSGFTLLELILVMLILAIVSAEVVPSLINFAMTRSTDNAVLQVMNLVQYARSQAVIEARTYRVNFDEQGGAIWVTVENAGVFQPAPNDFGNRMTLKDGMKLQVSIVPQGNTLLIMDPNVQPQDQDYKPAFGQPIWPSNNVQMQIPRTDPGVYMEIQPSGRTDPALVKLLDRNGKEIDLGLATSTDVFHVLKPEELK